MNEPIKHHYIPVFYLKRWADAGGYVCRYKKQYGGEVKAKRVVPGGTGFEKRLYGPLERDFMAKLDNDASEALKLLEESGPSARSEQRTNWSRFLLAQMVRTPEGMAGIRSLARQDCEKMRELREAYAARRLETDPPTVQEYLDQRKPNYTDELAFTIARRLMDHPKIEQSFNNMHWRVLDVPSDKFRLLTSDRPVWLTASLCENDSFIVMPIGPRKLFTAVVDPRLRTY